MLIFQWDARKAKSNLEKHGVGFEEAATVFGDPSSLTVADPAHSQREERFISLGNSEAADCWLSCTLSAAIISGSSALGVPAGANG